MEKKRKIVNLKLVFSVFFLYICTTMKKNTKNFHFFRYFFKLRDNYY